MMNREVEDAAIEKILGLEKDLLAIQDLGYSDEEFAKLMSEIESIQKSRTYTILKIFGENKPNAITDEQIKIIWKRKSETERGLAEIKNNLTYANLSKNRSPYAANPNALQGRSPYARQVLMDVHLKNRGQYGEKVLLITDIEIENMNKDLEEIIKQVAAIKERAKAQADEKVKREAEKKEQEKKAASEKARIEAEEKSKREAEEKEKAKMSEEPPMKTTSARLFSTMNASMSRRFPRDSEKKQASSADISTTNLRESERKQASTSNPVSTNIETSKAEIKSDEKKLTVKEWGDLLTARDIVEFSKLTKEGLLANGDKDKQVRQIGNQSSKLSHFVTSDILKDSDLKRTSSSIQQWVDIAYYLAFEAELKNYNAAFAINATVAEMASLQSRTKNLGVKLLSDDAEEKMKKLQDLMNPSSNYSNYRKAEKGNTAIPFLPVAVRDLIYFNESNESSQNDRKMNSENQAKLTPEENKLIKVESIIGNISNINENIERINEHKEIRKLKEVVKANELKEQKKENKQKTDETVEQAAKEPELNEQKLQELNQLFYPPIEPEKPRKAAFGDYEEYKRSIQKYKEDLQNYGEALERLEDNRDSLLANKAIMAPRFPSPPHDASQADKEKFKESLKQSKLMFKQSITNELGIKPKLQPQSELESEADLLRSTSKQISKGIQNVVLDRKERKEAEAIETNQKNEDEAIEIKQKVQSLRQEWSKSEIDERAVERSRGSKETAKAKAEIEIKETREEYQKSFESLQAVIRDLGIQDQIEPLSSNLDQISLLGENNEKILLYDVPKAYNEFIAKIKNTLAFDNSEIRSQINLIKEKVRQIEEIELNKRVHNPETEKMRAEVEYLDAIMKANTRCIEAINSELTSNTDLSAYSVNQVYISNVTRIQNTINNINNLKLHREEEIQNQKNIKRKKEEGIDHKKTEEDAIAKTPTKTIERLQAEAWAWQKISEKENQESFARIFKMLGIEDELDDRTKITPILVGRFPAALSDYIDSNKEFSSELKIDPGKYNLNNTYSFDAYISDIVRIAQVISPSIQQSLNAAADDKISQHEEDKREGETMEFKSADLSSVPEINFGEPEPVVETLSTASTANKQPSKEPKKIWAFVMQGSGEVIYGEDYSLSQNKMRKFHEAIADEKNKFNDDVRGYKDRIEIIYNKLKEIDGAIPDKSSFKEFNPDGRLTLDKYSASLTIPEQEKQSLNELINIKNILLNKIVTEFADGINQSYHVFTPENKWSLSHVRVVKGAGASSSDLSKSDVTGFVTGKGESKKIAACIEELRQAKKDGQLPERIILSGHSRGASSCIELARAIYLEFGDEIKIAMNISDPVPGPGRHTKSKMVIPPNVDSVMISYAGSDTNPLFVPQDAREIHFDPGKTTVTTMVFPANHIDFGVGYDYSNELRIMNNYLWDAQHSTKSAGIFRLAIERDETKVDLNLAGKAIRNGGQFVFSSNPELNTSLPPHMKALHEGLQNRAVKAVNKNAPEKKDVSEFRDTRRESVSASVREIKTETREDRQQMLDSIYQESKRAIKIDSNKLSSKQNSTIEQRSTAEQKTTTVREPSPEQKKQDKIGEKIFNDLKDNVELNKQLQDLKSFMYGYPTYQVIASHMDNAHAKSYDHLSKKLPSFLAKRIAIKRLANLSGRSHDEKADLALQIGKLFEGVVKGKFNNSEDVIKQLKVYLDQLEKLQPEIVRDLNGKLLSQNDVEKVYRGEVIGNGASADYSAHKTALNIGYSELRGKRLDQEDRVVASELKDCPKDINIEALLENTIEEAHKKCSESGCGSTLVTSVIHNDTIYTANVGDSSSYFVTVGKNGEISVTRLNENIHHPNDVGEREHIQSNGGMVWQGRMDNGRSRLAISRAIGDSEFGAAIRHTPDISQRKIDIPEGGYAFMVTSCDGLTENHDSSKSEAEKQIKKLVTVCMLNGAQPIKDPANFSQALAMRAIQYERSGDNVSVIVTPLIKGDTKTKVVSVFDGHGGSTVSQSLHENYSSIMNDQLNVMKHELSSKRTAVI